MRRTFARIAAIGFACLVVTTACNRMPGRSAPLVSILYVIPANVVRARDSAMNADDALAGEGGLIVLDSAALRPVVAARGGSGFIQSKMNDSTFLDMHLVQFTTITTYQGGRYHPETIRALAVDSTVLVIAANSIVAASTHFANQFILDAQGITPDDLPALTDLVRATSRVASRRGRGRPLGVVLPPGDTVAYPTSVLARVADLLVLRLHGEHRPGTAPGPLTSPEFIAREIGIRARSVGTNRLVAELPLYGYRWNSDGTAAPITFAEAQALVVAEAGAFTRDPASQFLSATGRVGWTVWIPDAQTVETMLAAVRRRGVTQITLAGVIGADPEIPRRIAALLKQQSGRAGIRPE